MLLLELARRDRKPQESHTAQDTLALAGWGSVSWRHPPQDRLDPAHPSFTKIGRHAAAGRSSVRRCVRREVHPVSSTAPMGLRTAWLLAAAVTLGAASAAGPMTQVQKVEAAETDPDWLRYELGRRMRALERVFAQADTEARARALGELEAAVASFFRNDVPAAARALDAARRSLESAEAAA